MTKAILKLKRGTPAHGCILGELSLNGKFFCYTLEREGVAIPADAYQVLLSVSPKFRKLMPHLVGPRVPASWGVRIHSGTTAADSDGCVLVGLARLPSNTKIYRSQEAFEKLMVALLPFGTIELTIA